MDHTIAIPFHDMNLLYHDTYRDINNVGVWCKADRVHIERQTNMAFKGQCADKKEEFTFYKSESLTFFVLEMFLKTYM